MNNMMNVQYNIIRLHDDNNITINIYTKALDMVDSVFFISNFMYEENGKLYIIESTILENRFPMLANGRHGQ